MKFLAEMDCKTSGHFKFFMCSDQSQILFELTAFINQFFINGTMSVLSALKFHVTWVSQCVSTRNSSASHSYTSTAGNN